MTEREAVISGECRVETVPSSEGALLKGLRLELDLQLAPATTDGKEPTLAVLRVSGARLLPARASVPAYQLWSVVAGAAVLVCSMALWFALEPEPAELPIEPVVIESSAVPPKPAAAPLPAPPASPVPPMSTPLPGGSPTLPSRATGGPVVSLVHPPSATGAPPTPAATAPAKDAASNAVNRQTQKSRPAPGAAALPKTPAARPPALAAAPAESSAVALAAPEPKTPRDVLDLFADTK